MPGTVPEDNHLHIHHSLVSSKCISLFHQFQCWLRYKCQGSDAALCIGCT